MISAIEGLLENVNNDSVIVKAGSLSFTVYISNSTFHQLGKIGEKVYLFTHLHLREDNIALFGFSTQGELQIFQKLLLVSGVGPRVALALLSSLEPQQLVSAIVGNNIDMICQAPGVGKKLAGRIILELKSRLEKEGIGDLVPVLTSADYSDVVDALVSLGYSFREASQAVMSLSPEKNAKLEDKIKLALQYLASK